MKQKTICFKQPYSNSVKSNIGNQVLKLVSQHFPGHRLNKIVNKNSLKASYSCMRNISSILSNHNRKVLSKNEKQYQCNCRNKNECPLENKYFTPRVIYEAEVITWNTSRKFYIEFSYTPFKEHYYNKKRGFRKRRYEKSIELSNFIWSLQKIVQNSLHIGRF